MILLSAWRAVVRRWYRNLLMATAVMLSAATAMALIGFVHSAAHRTATTLTALSSSSVSVALPGSAWDVPENELLRQVRQFPQVVNAGILNLPDEVAPLTLQSERNGTSVTTGVAVATRAGLDVRGVKVISGAFPGTADSDQPTTVLIGRRLATELRIGDPHDTVLTANGVRVGLAGIVDDGSDGSILSASIIVSPPMARRLAVLPANMTVQITLTPGTAEQLSNQFRLALYPRAPEEVSVTIPPSPRKLQEQLTAESATWVSVITSVLGAVSAFTIVTTMQVAVQERRREIGVRRAMGVKASQIAIQFCFEAMLVGGLASTFGAAIGAIAVNLWAAFAGWDILMPPYILLLPLIGLLIGGLSGVIPAVLATRVDPSELLRAA